MIGTYLGFALAVGAALEYTTRLFVGRAVFTTRHHDVAVAADRADRDRVLRRRQRVLCRR